MPDDRTLVAFLEGTGAGSRGLTVDDILALDDGALESRHDYIQWLFPLDVPSQAVPGSPVLTPADIQAIRASAAARHNIRRAAARMRAFYADNNHWLSGHDHNHLRITRIIASLRMLAGAEAAEDFRQFVLHLNAAAGSPVNARSVGYWRAA